MLPASRWSIPPQAPVATSNASVANVCSAAPDRFSRKRLRNPSGRQGAGGGARRGLGGEQAVLGCGAEPDAAPPQAVALWIHTVAEQGAERRRLVTGLAL